MASPLRQREGDKPEEVTYFVFGENILLRQLKEGRVIVILRTGIEQDGKDPISTDDSNPDQGDFDRWKGSA